MIGTKFVKSPKGKWDEQKAKIKMKFPKLLDKDLDFDENRKDEMLKHLEPKLAMTASELNLILESL